MALCTKRRQYASIIIVQPKNCDIKVSFLSHFLASPIDPDSDLPTINFQPGIGWAPIFLEESNFFVLELYFKYWYYFRNRDSEIFELLNESISILSSLRGEIFQNQPQRQFAYMFFIGSTLIKIIAEYVHIFFCSFTIYYF